MKTIRQMTTYVFVTNSSQFNLTSLDKFKVFDPNLGVTLILSNDLQAQHYSNQCFHHPPWYMLQDITRYMA